MDTSQSDAEALWSDVLLLCIQKGVPSSVQAMFKSCTPLSFDGKRLTMGTNLAFAQKKIAEQTPFIEKLLEEAAFEPLKFEIVICKNQNATPINTSAQMTSREVDDYFQEHQVPYTITDGRFTSIRDHFIDNHEEALALYTDEKITYEDSKLTFSRFVAGEENMLAYEAAKQVANGDKSYNTLFIYGKSGLGKTHLLRAIQNYIQKNDPTRSCIYRTSSEFVDSYVKAMNNDDPMAKNEFTRKYKNVDVLIIDDIQNMRTAAGTIRFFFETFNALTSRGKQIVLAADRSPLQLGMGKTEFDERVTSRMDSGLTVSIQVPDFELKLKLINNFYEHMRQDAVNEHIKGMDATISEENRKYMAEKAGTNIRIIEGFVLTCLTNAYKKEQKGEELTKEDILRISQVKWPSNQRIITVEQIQKAIEINYDVAHNDLIGNKRNKELMEPRHVGIWLTRELTDFTLADIGKRYGGRSHATVKHSIYWVEKMCKEDRIFQDKVETIKDSIREKL